MAAQSLPDPYYERRPPFETRALRRSQSVLKKLAQRIAWELLGGIGYLTRDRAPLPLPKAGDPTIRRILIVRVDMLGDTVLTTPAVRALRRAFPHAKIDLLARSSTAGILAGDPDLDRVLSYDSSAWTSWRRLGEIARLFATVRHPRYDLALSICGDMGSILTRLTGARRRVGYVGEAYPYFMTHPVRGKRYDRPQHETRYVLDLANVAGGCVTPEDERPWLRVLPGPSDTIAGHIEMARATLDRHGPVIAIHPGAKNGRAKRWPIRHYARLSDRLSRELGALIVLTGSPNEQILTNALAARMSEPYLDLTGKTSLPELTALMAASAVVVTGDSGPMHIACAVNTPVVAIHGPTDPGLSGPSAPDALILRRNLWCAPCYDASATAECRFGNPICMKDISPDEVFAATVRQLALPADYAEPIFPASPLAARSS